MSVIRALLGCLAASVLLGAATLASAVAGFAVVLRFMEATVGDRPAPPPAPPPPPASVEVRPSVDATLQEDGDEKGSTKAQKEPDEEVAEVDPKLVKDEAREEPAPAEPPPPPSPDQAFTRTVAAVRLHRPIDSSALVALDCDQLQWARNWVWASRGLPFESDEAKAWFKDKDGYRPQEGLTLDGAEALMNEIDLANRNLLGGALKAKSCPCPAGQPKKPCPK